MNRRDLTANLRMRAKMPVTGRRMNREPRQDVTALLMAWRDGDEAALRQLTPLVYDELHRLAERCMRGEQADHTLQTTALVNEAYIRLVDSSRVRWQNRAHFFAIAAQLMRRILVDFARRRRFQKRGGHCLHITLADGLDVATNVNADLVAVDDALQELSRLDARKAQVVELRFFGGMTLEEAAEALKVSTDTVGRDWRAAKAWLTRELKR
jgi:RNA polymerase sigma factor (TIGR02999 family)